MYTNNNSDENFNELVFENRNKEYGAYVIRKSYHDNMTISLFIALGFFGFLSLAGALFSSGKKPADKNGTIFKIDSLVTIPFDFTPDKPIIPDNPDKIKPIPPTPPKSNSNYFQATDTHVDTNPDPSLPVVKNGDPKGVDTAKSETPDVFVVKKPSTPTPPEPPSTWVPQMPDFEGGITQYISKNLVYPRVAVEDMRDGTVYLTFVVETDGSVSNVKVLKGIGDGCEEEAVRVIKSMPKWKPGKNNGQPVRVQFNLPVKFTIH